LHFHRPEPDAERSHLSRLSRLDGGLRQLRRHFLQESIEFVAIDLPLELDALNPYCHEPTPPVPRSQSPQAFPAEHDLVIEERERARHREAVELVESRVDRAFP
jgi:hypothetical protein